MTGAPLSLDRAELTNLSLFTGAGGMEIGLESAGFRPVACLELDEPARRTLVANRPHWNVLEDGDVIASAEHLTPDQFGLSTGELDLISGGPPCQPFSTAAQWAQSGRRGMSDVRAGTISALLKFTAAFLPKAVMLENVYGFVNGPNSAWETLLKGFDGINRENGTSYVMNWRLINAADVGVPQNRRRVILIALRDGSMPKWPDYSHSDNPRTSGDAFAGLKEEQVPTPSGKWTDLLASIPEGENYQWLTSRGGGEELFGYRTKYWNFLLKLAANQPSWTLSASPGPSTGPFHWDNRPLTSREMMRLQTFPDSWELHGDPRTQTKLIGNATPALLAEVVGNSVRESLTGLPGSSASLGKFPERDEPHVLRPVLPVPPRFRAAIGTKISHAGTGRGPAPRLVNRA
jgi:DNA (cytosine-5)-methyltransferase 1